MLPRLVSRTALGTPSKVQPENLLKEVPRAKVEASYLRGTIRSPETRTLHTLGIMKCPGRWKCQHDPGWKWKVTLGSSEIERNRGSGEK